MKLHKKPKASRRVRLQPGTTCQRLCGSHNSRDARYAEGAVFTVERDVGDMIFGTDGSAHLARNVQPLPGERAS